MIIVKKIIINVVKVVDYTILVFVFPFCLVVLVVAIPWILTQRKIWRNFAKGNRKVLIILSVSLEKIRNRGYEHLLPFRNPDINWIGILDPANSLKSKAEITNGLYLITLKLPKIITLIKNSGFTATSLIFRELIAIFRITNYCVKNQIGVLRAARLDFPALRAWLVSIFIKIPFIVDITGNYELIRRLTGKTSYFRDLNKIPFIRIFARKLCDWLLGWPLRYAFHVLGRNKNNYENAFALGAPVDRLSLLRITNFNAAFNAYNPEQPPTKPAEYPYMLFVGRLAKINFPLDVLDAFNIAAPQLPEYRLVIIGDGAIRNEVEHRIECSEYKDRIIFMGACPNDIVYNWTAHAKVAICPYSGATLVEAMLCGIPVIAYDIEWHAEVILDDYTGYLVPFTNTEALAEKLLYVVNNYEEARIAALRGRELAHVVFDKDRISKKESMYYMQALTNSHG
jgi:glycosyltransferase involved in cell wall biosynthesis